MDLVGINLAGIIGEPPYLKEVIVKHEGKIIYHAEWMKAESGGKNFQNHIRETTALKDKDVVNLEFKLTFSRKLNERPVFRADNQEITLSPIENDDYSYVGRKEFNIGNETTVLQLSVGGKDLRGLKLNSQPGGKIGIENLKIMGYVPDEDTNHVIRIARTQDACDRLTTKFSEKLQEYATKTHDLQAEIMDDVSAGRGINPEKYRKKQITEEIQFCYQRVVGYINVIIGTGDTLPQADRDACEGLYQQYAAKLKELNAEAKECPYVCDYTYEHCEKELN